MPSIPRPSETAFLRGELDWLTFCRFVAAGWVVFHHVGFAGIELAPFAASRLLRLLENGHFGVVFFFVLSGFILTHVYGPRPSIDLRGFLVARFARIYPVHLLALLVALPLLVEQLREHVANRGSPRGEILLAVKSAMALTLTQAWLPSAALAWNGVSWSLSAEAFFYLVFPWILPRVRRATTLRVALLLIGCVAFEAARLAWCEVRSEVGWSFLPLLRVASFVAGICLRLLLDRGLRIPRWSLLPALAGALVFLTQPTGSFAGLFVAFAAAQVAVLLLVGGLAIPRSGTAPGRLMGILVRLGEISYAMYLLHYPLAAIWSDLAPESAPSRHFFVYFGILLAICWAVHSWIETPARDRIRRWDAARRRRGAATPSASTGAP